MQEHILGRKGLGQFMPVQLLKQLQRRNGKIIGYIFRAKITINGVEYYAKNYGHKAFKIPIYA